MTETKRMRPLLGTFIEIGVLSNNTNVNKIVTETFNIIEQVQTLLSFHNPDSQLTKLNQSGNLGIDLDPISADVLKLALDITKRSHGEFNCTIGGALVNKGILPNHHDKEALLACGNENDVILKGKHARLVRPVIITLDGIAKGYAVDLAIDYLQDQGIESAWVNAGGDMRMYGQITLPVYQRQIDQSIVYLGEFANTAIATSSNELDYDPRSPGMILDNNYLSAKTGVWTINASLTWLADALTKVACINQSPKNRIVELGGTLLLGNST